MQVLTEKLRAPELTVEHWLNSTPLRLVDLRGRIVLIDFWDYTCINCLHTLPYLQEWHRRYQQAGLTILGIHAPEFDFAHEPERVAQAVKTLDIAYPVAQDNSFKTWNAFANRAWPAKYLIDPNGYIRAFHHGEGAYVEMEKQIQTLLLDIHPALNLPKPMSPVRAIDQSGQACYRPTPELYLGYGRGELGNPVRNLSSGQTIQHTAPEERLLHTIYLEGTWLNQKEYIETVSDTQNASLLVEYQAGQVNCVMGTVDERPRSIEVLLDGKPVPEKDWGTDMALIDGNTVITVDCYRMFQLLSHSDFEQHQLSLRVMQSGLRAYALTFVGCVV